MSKLEERFSALQSAAKERGYNHFLAFKMDSGDKAKACVAWGMEKGAPTPRALLAVLPEGSLGDTAAEMVLAMAWQTPIEGADYPVVALVEAGGSPRIFDLNPSLPHEIDQLPPATVAGELGQMQQEPRFRWSLNAYERLQGQFDDFHERVYSAVRDTVDGKNDIIDETAKFLFLELYRLRHTEEQAFTHEGQQFKLSDVFRPEPFESGDKRAREQAVEHVKAAFEAFKGHEAYTTTLEDGGRSPIFASDVHLKLSNPANYASLIRILQDLGPLTDNAGHPYPRSRPRQGTLIDISGDVLGRAFDVFLRHKFQKEGVGIYLTPSPVKLAMVDMALHDIESTDYAALATRDARGAPTFRVCDPAAGSGGFLVALLPQLKRLLERLGGLSNIEREAIWIGMLEHSFHAADSSPRMVRLARLNMALQGAPRARVLNIPSSLVSQALQPCSFDLILTNPPFGTPQAKKPEEKKAVAELMERFRSDVDFEALRGKGGTLRPSPLGLAMGCAPNGKGVWLQKDQGVDLSVLFLDRCLQLLKPGGRLVMIVPDSLLCNKDTRFVREYLMGKKDEATGQFHGGKAIVRAVISLPADTFKLAGTGAKTSILYVQKRKADPKDPTRFVDEPQDAVFMAVADQLGYTVKGNAEVYEVGGKYIPNDLVPIVGAYRRGE